MWRRGGPPSVRGRGHPERDDRGGVRTRVLFVLRTLSPGPFVGAQVGQERPEALPTLAAVVCQVVADGRGHRGSHRDGAHGSAQGMFSSQRGNGLHSQRQADRYRFAGVVGARVRSARPRRRRTSMTWRTPWSVGSRTSDTRADGSGSSPLGWLTAMVGLEGTNSWRSVSSGSGPARKGEFVDEFSDGSAMRS